MPSTGYWAMVAFKQLVGERVLRVARGLIAGRWLRVSAFCARVGRSGGAVGGDVALLKGIAKAVLEL